MRALVATLLLPLCGCNPKTDAQQPLYLVTSGKDQLTIQWSATGSSRDEHPGYEFDRLVWLTETNGRLKERAVLTREQLQIGAERRRWVSELHSFDPRTGNAIVKMGEDSSQATSYSWRQWNLLTNAEVRFIRVCSNRFEKY